jgi:hypothetical protein
MGTLAFMQRLMVNVDAHSPEDRNYERWSHHDGCWVDRLTGWKLQIKMKYEAVFLTIGHDTYEFPYFVHNLVNPEECVIHVYIKDGGLLLPDKSTQIISPIREPEIYTKIKEVLQSFAAREGNKFEIIEAANA